MLAYSGKKVCYQQKIKIEIKSSIILGTIPVHDLITEYLKLCIDFDHPWENAKYSLRAMLQPLGKLGDVPIGKAFEVATSLEEIWLDVMYSVQIS